MRAAIYSQRCAAIKRALHRALAAPDYIQRAYQDALVGGN